MREVDGPSACFQPTMSSQWLRNHTGATLTDAEFADVPSPRVELTVHVTMKTVQALGLLGTVLVGPLVAVARSSSRSAAGVARLSAKSGKIGATIGLLIGVPLTMARMRTLDDDAVVDRCFRLRHNRGQVRVDRASAVGAVAGGLVGAVTSLSVPYGALLGMSGGILAMAVYNNK